MGENKIKKEKIPKYKLKKEDIHRLINYATKVPEAAKAFKAKVKKNIAKAILSSFAFVAAFIWRDVIRDTIDLIVKRLGIEGSGYIFTIISALIVTTLCAIGIMAVARWSEKK